MFTIASLLTGLAAALSLVTSMFPGTERTKALGVFYINVPVGLALLVALPKVVSAATTRAGIFALINVGDYGWTSAPTLWAVALSVAGFVGFGLIEQTVRTPLVDPRIIVRRSVLTGALLLAGSHFLGSFYLSRRVASFTPASVWWQ